LNLLTDDSSRGYCWSGHTILTRTFRVASFIKVLTITLALTLSILEYSIFLRALWLTLMFNVMWKLL
jgi:hypothetical protein